MRIATELVTAGEVSASPPPDTSARIVRLVVEDDGVGMSRECRERAFEPFYTEKGPGEGTGLGLSMVYGTVTNHQGTVQIESEPGQGCRVVVSLPGKALVSEDEEDLDGARLTSSERRGGVLIVDDEALVRRSIQRALQGVGYRVFEAGDGVEAFEVFEREREEIDVVVLDMVMPERDGPETSRMLRDVDPAVQVVVVSGFAKDEKVEALLGDGARCFVAKPFEVGYLERVVADAVEARFHDRASIDAS